MREHQRETEKVNKGEHLKEQVRDKGKKPEVVASDKALDDDDQAKKALDDDDTRSLNNSEDEDERVRCPKFNEKTSISNPQLCKGMKFPNGMVFRVALSEYAMKKPVDIKFKLDEKTKVFVHCKCECGWKVYMHHKFQGS